MYGLGSLGFRASRETARLCSAKKPVLQVTKID